MPKTTTKTNKSSNKKAGPNASINFEESLAELEDLVDDMEAGDLTMEEALDKFEKGIILTKTCQKALKDAEQRVNVLLKKNGEPLLEPFSDSDE